MISPWAMGQNDVPMLERAQRALLIPAHGRPLPRWIALTACHCAVGLDPRPGPMVCAGGALYAVIRD
jgi:hypothetical protein